MGQWGEIATERVAGEISFTIEKSLDILPIMEDNVEPNSQKLNLATLAPVPLFWTANGAVGSGRMGDHAHVEGRNFLAVEQSLSNLPAVANHVESHSLLRKIATSVPIPQQAPPRRLLPR